MFRMRSLLPFVMALVVLAAAAGLVGCAGGNNSVIPPKSDLTADSNPPVSPSGDGVVLGWFQFVFDDNGTVRVEDAAPVRGAELNVTKFASVIIENFFFNEKERNWYITASIKNISMYTGYDVLAVFHSLGNKFVTNQDGFIWALPPIFPEPTRCAFIAYGKAQPDRVYPPMFQDTRTIVMHQPEGVPKLAPLGFWIEGYAHPRGFPGVEDLAVELLPYDIYPPMYRLTGFVWDHQSPSSDLTAWADCTKFNGVNYVQMFDDGQHGDGAAGDNIWGCTFQGDPDDGYYVITVYAFDPQGNQGENDVGFWEGQVVPCDKPFEYYPFATIDKGEHSGINYQFEQVINDADTWASIWNEHTGNQTPPPPPPPIDFNKNTVVGVWTGDRPTNNHIVTITDVYFDPCEKLVTVLYDYTPYIGCGPLDVIDDPFHIVMLPKIDWPVYFCGKEVDCPPPPPECQEDVAFETLIQGPNSGIHGPYGLLITTHSQFSELWKEHTKSMYPPPGEPQVDWAKHNVVAVGLGDRPTGGFECVIDHICVLTDGHLGVFYKERIPGPDCAVPQIITQPHHWVVIPKIETTPQPEFFGQPEVYNCGGGDCQEPLMFLPIDQGPHTGHPPGEFVIKGGDAWEEFWSMHNPNTPPPFVDFNKNMVLAMLIGERPSTGYIVETIQVCLNPNDDGSARMDAKYVEHQPGKNCDVLWVVTTPFQLVVVPRFDGPVFFHHEIDTYDCPDECAPVPWQPVENGDQSCDEPGTFGFQGFGDWFHEHWVAVHCWGPDDPGYMPGVPPADPGTQWVPFEIQLPEKPSTGYYSQIDDVCIKGCDVYVTYTDYIPGETCQVEWVITKPWSFWYAQLPEIDCEYIWHFEGKEVVYQCPEPCNPVPFYGLADGQHGCADPGEYGFQDMDGYENFWKQVNCDNPEMPPLPLDPEPIQGGIFYHFGIQLPERPTTGYYLTIDKVCIDGCDVFIDYTENIPAKNCDVNQVITKPWIVGAVELPPVYCYWTWHFTKHEVVYDCIEPCWKFEVIADGEFAECYPPGGWFFDNPEAWEAYWKEFHPGETPPPIDFSGGWGAYAIHLGHRPTTGYDVEVYEICQSHDPFGAAVRWIEWIPGQTCQVEAKVNTPWTIVTFPLVDLPYFDEGHSEVYECK